MPDHAPPVPVDSATVALLREPVPGRLEVLLVGRHAESRAFAGAHVFPGGLVDPADHAADLHAAMSAPMTPDTARAILGGAGAPAAALAFLAATIRELFEEAGILLANDAHGAPLGFGDPATRERFAAHRRALLGGAVAFAEIVRREGLTLRTGDLGYFSRWITPVHAPRRYDARFFVAPVPADQAPLHDERETTSAAWWTPADALAGAVDGSIVLTPPQARTLEELIDLGTMARVLASTRERTVTPILPKVVQIGDRMGVLYPGDVDYDETEPGAALPAERDGRLNRIIMDDAGWRRFRGIR
ncbi:MAG: NUDIX hydrolase [Deltaproteobacteria bacterium]|nr:NUDIX hydrolase [Deltaproteobacteria bacterium]